MWDSAYAEQWPQVDQLLRSTPPGEHAHAKWYRAKEINWWYHWGMDPNGTENELFLETEEGLYRISVLSSAFPITVRCSPPCCRQPRPAGSRSAAGGEPHAQEAP